MAVESGITQSLTSQFLFNHSKFRYYVQAGNVDASLPTVSRMTHA